MTEPLGIAVVGAGSWGQNLVRNFANARRARLKYVCDRSEEILAAQTAAFPGVQGATDYEVVLSDREIRAVVIATDAPSHFAMAMRALQAGKHVFVEKPLALSSADAAALVEAARKAGVKLMVGHLLLHHPAVQAIEGMIRGGDLGRVYYIYTQRINLGVVRSTENAWWSLAPHDVSVICRWYGAVPLQVAAQGQCFLQKGVEDVVFATLKFADGRMAHVHVSWLDPHKIRKMTIVGSQKMVVFDDMSANEKIWIYDKGAHVSHSLRDFADVVSLRVGDIVIPKVASGEPLALECRHFVDCVLDDRPPLTDGEDGLRVVKVLEAGQRSLKSGGAAADVE